MKQYSAVVAANKGYQPGMSAFIYSFREHHPNNEIKLYCLDYDLEAEFREKHDSMVDEWVKISHPKGHVHACKLQRFEVACEIGGVVGVYDSDMYFTASMLNWYKVADAGFVVGGSNASNNRYGAHWHEKFKMDDIPEIFDYVTLTSVPTIMDIEKHGNDVWGGLYKHKAETGAGADFDLLNIFLMKTGRINDIITIPCECATGVHHLQCKPETRAYWKGGKLMTMNGLVVYTVHGRFWEGNWCANLMKPIPKHLARMGIRSSLSKAYQGALQSRDLLQAEFDKYCHWPYDKSVKEATLENVKRETDLFFVESADMESENAALAEKNLELATRIEKLEHELRKQKKVAREHIMTHDPTKPILKNRNDPTVTIKIKPISCESCGAKIPENYRIMAQTTCTSLGAKVLCEKCYDKA